MSVNMENTKTRDIADAILKLKETMVDQRAMDNNDNYSSTISKDIKVWRHNLIDIYANSIINDLETSYENLKNWGEQAVNLLIDLDLPLDIAIEEIRNYRDRIGEIIKNEAEKQELSYTDFYEVLSRFNSVVDRAVHWLSISYSRKYYTRIHAAESVALELSVPVIKVTDTIGILPLVGDIDTKRAHELMDKALVKGSQLGLDHIILDLSGVPIIDTMVADRIFKVIDALGLSGISATLTGIRPEIAQTMTNLGINISTIPIYSSLHIAMKTLQNH
ncbi:STAS domain-containing protein [Rossellomorea aquimaris]|uniref:STAS domain-containing protein n=1 Tax=Rossellomorea aquimaris TaxID=189382 RepID=UPI001CD355C9|nr:STAS domain-containing protein [Rossellomorea aquimaris]MCA1053748.1 STAS domain-containing protein [Rossellomorea aquimaris]